MAPHPPSTPPTPPPPSPSSGDPFDTLGLPAKYALASAEVERAYLARAGTLHPDRSTGDAAAASALNRARQTLKDPLARAEALLARLGGPAPSEDKLLPPKFLEHILQVREQLEAALASGDPAQRAHWESWAEDQRRGHISVVTPMFDDQTRPVPPSSLRTIRLELNVWRYTERVLEQLGGAGDASGGTGL